MLSMSPAGSSQSGLHSGPQAWRHDEAQANVSQSIAESLRDYFEKRSLGNAVNAPVVDPVLRSRIGPYAELARRLGMFVAGYRLEMPLKLRSDIEGSW